MESRHHTTRPGADATPKTVTVRMRSHDPTSATTCTLVPRENGVSGPDAGFEVHRDGQWVGTVSSCAGSLDRKVPNGGRTLWSATFPGNPRPYSRPVSRAEAVRMLTG